MAVFTATIGECRFITTAGSTKPTAASHVGLPQPVPGDKCWDSAANIIYATPDGTNWVLYKTQT